MTALLPAFQNPVQDSQACFRAVLDALSQPGTIHSAAVPHVPAPLGHAVAAVVLTLCDAETPLWLDPAAAAAAPWIAFHCGAPAAAPGAAAFAVVLGMLDLVAFAAGTDEAPEQGATVIVEVAGLGHGAAFTLSGPGLEHPVPFAVDGLPPDFARHWATNRARFPRGVDLILCAGDRFAALPRTVEIR